MKTITLQTRNIDITIKEKAEKRARQLGYATMQDVIRVFLKDFAEGIITPKTTWNYESILSKASNRSKSDKTVMNEVIKQIKNYRKINNV